MNRCPGWAVSPAITVPSDYQDEPPKVYCLLNHCSALGLIKRVKYLLHLDQAFQGHRFGIAAITSTVRSIPPSMSASRIQPSACHQSS